MLRNSISKWGVLTASFAFVFLFQNCGEMQSPTIGDNAASVSTTPSPSPTSSQVSCTYSGAWTAINTTITNNVSGSYYAGVTTDKLGNIYSLSTVSGAKSAVAATVQKSTDQGKTWTVVDSFMSTNTTFGMGTAITSDSSGNIYYSAVGVSYFNGHGVVRKSADQGATWTTVDDYIYPGGGGSATAYFRSIGVDKNGYIYTTGSATDNNGTFLVVRQSKDAGTTWATIYVLANAAGFAFGSDIQGNLYVVGSGSAGYTTWQSKNGGTTWVAIDTVAYTGGSYSLGRGFGSDSAGNLYTVGEGDDASTAHYVTRRSADHGVTWQTVDDIDSGIGLEYDARAITVGFDLNGSVYTGGVLMSGGNASAIIRKSSNGSTGWTTVDQTVAASYGTDLLNSGIGNYSFAIDSGGNLFVVGLNAGTADPNLVTKEMSCK